MKRNAAIFRGLLPEIVRYAPDAIVVIAANPVNVLTHLAVELSGLPSARIIGSGTILDTARFRVLLGRHLDIDPQSVHAWVVGEHGDSEVPVWSGANVAGMSLAAYAAANGIPFDDAIRVRIAAETRDAAARIIARKGSTYYAIGAGLLRIVEAILRDERAVLWVFSHPREGHPGPSRRLSEPSRRRGPGWRRDGPPARAGPGGVLPPSGSPPRSCERRSRGWASLGYARPVSGSFPAHA